MKKLLAVIALALVVVMGVNAKIRDEWRGDFREVDSKYEKYRGGWPPIKMCIERRIHADTNDTINIFIFEFPTFSNNDPSYRKGDKMQVRLGNDEVVTGTIYYTAEPTPKVTKGDGGVHYTTLPNRYPGYSFSNEDYYKIAKHGVKKIRISHSNGNLDYVFEGKDFEKFKKKFLKNFNAVNEQAKKPAPYRYIPQKHEF